MVISLDCCGNRKFYKHFKFYHTLNPTAIQTTSVTTVLFLVKTAHPGITACARKMRTNIQYLQGELNSSGKI